ncbi:MAG: hypothetical protein JWR36_1137 [Glaciihabitans sp.]|jgi:hypothetical protein|nr:hypothetical protein [Glaciihabitans sp.]
MKHLTFADKSILLGDQTADLIMEYAALLAQRHTADTVTVHAIGADGNDVEATLLLDQGAPLMIETATTTVQEPDNVSTEQYMSDRMQMMSSPPPGLALERDSIDQIEDWHHE